MKKQFILEVTYKTGTIKRINYSTAENAKKAYFKMCKRFSGRIKSYSVYDPNGDIVDSGLNRDYFTELLPMFPRKVFYRCVFTDPLGRQHEVIDYFVAETQEEYDNAIKALSVKDVEIISM